MRNFRSKLGFYDTRQLRGTKMYFIFRAFLPAATEIAVNKQANTQHSGFWNEVEGKQGGSLRQ